MFLLPRLQQDSGQATIPNKACYPFSDAGDNLPSDGDASGLLVIPAASSNNKYKLHNLAHPSSLSSMNPSEAAPLEPFGHDFLKPAPTHSEASRKRKKDDGSAFGSTTTDFSASTRDKLKALLHGQCFHCEMKPVLYSPMDVCHVIPKKSANVITPPIFLLPVQANETFSNSTRVILQTDSSISPSTMLLTAYSSAKIAITYLRTRNPAAPSCLLISNTLYNSKRRILIDGKRSWMDANRNNDNYITSRLCLFCLLFGAVQQRESTSKHGLERSLIGHRLHSAEHIRDLLCQVICKGGTRSACRHGTARPWLPFSMPFAQS